MIPRLKLTTGIVVSNADPLGRGRVQVRFPQYGTKDEIADADLPWAAVLGQGRAHNGAINPVEVGSAVVIGGINEEKDQLVVLGGYVLEGEPSSVYTGAMQGKKPLGRVIFDINGYKFYIDESSSTLQLKTPTGAEINIDSAGGITVKGSSINVQANNVNVEAAALARVTAPSVMLGEDNVDLLVKFSEMSVLFNAHVHDHTSPAGAGSFSGVPATPMTPLQATINTQAS